MVSVVLDNLAAGLTTEFEAGILFIVTSFSWQLFVHPIQIVVGSCKKIKLT